MSSKHLIALLPVAAVLVFSGIPAAQPAASARGRADERQERRRDDRHDRRDERHEKRDERRAERKEDRQDRADERRDRRQKKIAKLRARWGGLLQHPAVLAELTLHSRRMAKLQALRRIAEKEGKTALLPRIDKLMKKEQARHERHMDALKSRGSAAPTASTSYGGAK